MDESSSDDLHDPWLAENVPAMVLPLTSFQGV